jgi:osomolarity two-component system sensor histidine kinase SLN1
MVKIRIPIREQLVCLVFLATGISLTVIALAIWYTNHKFVLDLR